MKTMKREEVASMIGLVELPYAYFQFDENSGQQPPFICFYYPESDDMFADDQNYVNIDALTIELYTDEKDMDLERKTEAILKQNDISYQKREAYIEQEKMFCITYETEVIING